MQTPGVNWAESHRYHARGLHRPVSIAQAQEMVAATERIRALGSRHSFNDLADTSGDLITLADLKPDITIDEAAGTVTVNGAVTYGDLAPKLHEAGFALHAMASLPHISVAGAIATATHGSGDSAQNLAAAVVGLEMIGADGEIRTFTAGDSDFDGVVVALGALGITTRVTMRIEPTYQMRQYVFNDVPWELVLEGFDDVTSLGESVSLFPAWDPDVVDSIWVKRRTDRPDGAEPPAELAQFAASRNQHPVRSLDAQPCTTQLGEPGPWHDRLPHFKMGFTPSSGREIQTEYLVPRSVAVDAIRAASTLGGQVAEVLQISEVRTMAGDDLWLSPAYGRDTVSIHFTMDLEPAKVQALLPVIAETLAPFEARPHWAKWFRSDAATLAALYPRMGDFRDLAARMDPAERFVNDYLRDHVLPG